METLKTPNIHLVFHNATLDIKCALVVKNCCTIAFLWLPVLYQIWQPIFVLFLFKRSNNNGNRGKISLWISLCHEFPYHCKFLDKIQAAFKQEPVFLFQLNSCSPGQVKSPADLVSLAARFWCFTSHSGALRLVGVSVEQGLQEWAVMQLQAFKKEVPDLKH